MQNSNPTSSLPPARIGNTRILTPYALRALDLWTMLRVWPDPHDRMSLRQIQIAARNSPELGRPPSRRPISRMEMETVAMIVLRDRYLFDHRVIARHLFADACHGQARLFRITRPYDMSAAYAGLVEQLFSSEDEQLFYGDGEKSLALMSVLGNALIEEQIMAGPEMADILAGRICLAIAVNFANDATVPARYLQEGA